MPSVSFPTSCCTSNGSTHHAPPRLSPACLTRATVFFLYCPFSGRRLEQVLASIEELAIQRTVRLILVGMAQLTRSGWRALGSRSAEVDIYVSEGPRQV